MALPTRMDWAKIPRILAGTWPQPVPERIIVQPGDTKALDAALGLMDGFEQGYVVLDTEYNQDTKFLLMLGIGLRHAGVTQGAQIEWHHLAWWPKQQILRRVKTLVRAFPVVLQNLLADIPVLEQNMGIMADEYTRVDDLMLLHACLWSELPHTLEFLASIYGQHPKMKHLAKTDPFLYNWGDVLDTISAWEGVSQELEHDPLSRQVYQTQSLPIALRSLLPAKRRGILVNLPRVESASAENITLISAAESLARAWVGWPMKLGSNPHVAHYLYEHAALPRQKHRKTKKTTIEADAIAVLRAGLHPIPDLEEEEREGLTVEMALARIEEGADPILEARVLFAGARQVESHYLRPALHAKDGRFYPDFLLHAQASGRWSTNDPPLAQLPADLQDIICPDPGTTWLGWDWKQIEPRILEAITKDEEALARWDEDRYLRFTSIFFPGATPAHSMWDHYRKFTKRKILKMHYGGQPHSFTPGANKLGLDKKLETQASLRYLASRPRLTEWQRRTAGEALQTRTSRTFMGRLRRLLGDHQSLVGQAYDHPMQGAVSDIFNLTHVRILDELSWLWWVYGSHDSQWWGCPNEQVVETWPKLKAIVEQEWDIHGVRVRFPASWKERVA